MKKRFLNIFMTVCSAAAVFACARIEEMDVVHQPEMEFMTFNAVVVDESDPESKTLLEGQLGQSFRKVLWMSGDSIALRNDYQSHFSKFVNTNKDNSEEGSFSGEITVVNGAAHVGFYPYSSDLQSNGLNEIWYFQPAVQHYKEQSFASDAMPMVSYFISSQTGTPMKFRNVFGVLAINLTGSENIKSISFSGKDASGKPVQVAGHFKIDNIQSGSQFSFKPADGDKISLSTLSLDCGEGVALDPASAKPFYIVLPPATYSSFTLVVATTDGKLMLKNSSKPLTIKRANVTKTGSLPYVEEVSFDLSETGTANSYVVSEEGLYSFDATVIGNGEFGLVRDGGFHTSDPTIRPHSVELLWEDRLGVLAGLTFDGQNVSFLATGTKGNALVAVKDQAGNILWSWHIWVTDQPADQVYKVNGYGDFTMQDRNLGALSNERGTTDMDWFNVMGLNYQWGRKDPMACLRRGESYWDYTQSFTSQAKRTTIEQSISNPTVFYGRGYDSWLSDNNQNLWSTSQKTIYDPCPVGYRMPPRATFRVWTKDGNDAWGGSGDNMNIVGEYNRGISILYDGQNTAYYPAIWRINENGDYEHHENYTDLWTTECQTGQDRRAYRPRMYYYSYIESHIVFNDTDYLSVALPVRCMKDEGHVDISYPVLKVTDINNVSTQGATLVAEVTHSGISEVTDRGFIWGKTSDLSDGTEVKCGTGAGEFTTTLTSLEHSTRYYFKAYAVNGKGRSESKIKSFFTPYSGDAYDLSAKGTANCYIVPPVYTDYVFNCSVKGNSNESVGVPASAEVLWETRLNYQSISVGSVIESVELVGNFVKFRLPFDPLPGNALIAVKDANGTILWSWHIWVVDFDPEQTGCKLISGAKVMDRNLGALNVIPEYQGAETTDYSAYGLYYQWGRKDPAPLSGNILPESVISWNPNGDDYYSNVDATIKNPTHFVAYVNYPETSWSHKKTVYDPCPAGWRIPDVEIWNGIPNSDVPKSDDRTYRIIPEPYSTPQGYYPIGGEYYSYWSGFNSFNDWGRWWGVRQSSILEIHWSDVFGLSSQSSCFGLSVRCMKDEGTQHGDNEDFDESEDYEW